MNAYNVDFTTVWPVVGIGFPGSRPGGAALRHMDDIEAKYVMLISRADPQVSNG